MNQKKQLSFGRLVRYIFSHYKIQLIVTLICIVISAFSSSIATIFIQRLIDECITPGVNQGFKAVAGKFTSILLTMGFIYICGTIASIIYNQIMAIKTGWYHCSLHDSAAKIFSKRRRPYRRNDAGAESC